MTSMPSPSEASTVKPRRTTFVRVLERDDRPLQRRENDPVVAFAAMAFRERRAGGQK